MQGRPKNKKGYVQGILKFDEVCYVCGYRINKATDNICHGCNGGHNNVTHKQAVSMLGRGEKYPV